MAADVVTADGRLIHTDETENRDLFWALRGGGGDYDVVTRFQTDHAHPSNRSSSCCGIASPEERANEIIPLWRDLVESAPDELSRTGRILNNSTRPFHSGTHLRVGPSWRLPIFYFVPSEGEQVVAPLRSLGEPLIDFSGRMPYRTIQTL